MFTKKILLLMVMAAVLMAPLGNLFAEDVKITAIPVTGQIYMVTGNGGNIGLFIGDDGTLLIDDQYAPLTEAILATIKSVGGDAPKLLINTHYHGDHTGGNEALGSKGTLIFAHDNVRKALRDGSFIAAFKMKNPPAPKAALPVVTFAEDISFHLNGDTVRAMHVPHAHTDGDSIIHFNMANVIHAGDIYFNGFYPFVDTGHGGSLKGMIAAVDRVLALADDQTKIIPGHGPLSNRAELSSYRRMLGTAYDRLLKLKSGGMPVEAAIAAKPLEDLEPVWGDGLFKGEQWITLVYSGIY